MPPLKIHQLWKLEQSNTDKKISRLITNLQTASDETLTTQTTAISTNTSNRSRETGLMLHVDDSAVTKITHIQTCHHPYLSPAIISLSLSLPLSLHISLPPSPSLSISLSLYMFLFSISLPIYLSLPNLFLSSFSLSPLSLSLYLSFPPSPQSLPLLLLRLIPSDLDLQLKILHYILH